MDTLDLAGDVVGTGPPLVVLHGLFGSHRNWAGIARGLSGQAEVYSWDLRNHGASPWSAQMDYDGMAADVVHAIEARSLPPATVLGHSMGGKVAMRLASLRPELVRRLIVVDIAPVAYHNEHYSDFIAAMLALPLDRLGRRDEADALLKPVIQDDMLRAFLLQNLIRDGDAFRWRLNLAGIGANMAELIGYPAGGAAFAGPTIFIAGERSNYIRPRDQATILALFPTARMLEVADAGHWPHAEQPDRFLSLVRSLLDG